MFVTIHMGAFIKPRNPGSAFDATTTAITNTGSVTKIYNIYEVYELERRTYTKFCDAEKTD